MIQGLYAAANGMIAVEDRQAVIANNIANVSTNGFKRQLSVQTGYYGMFTDASSAAALGMEVAPGGGLKTSETFSYHGNGSVVFTGGALDIALIGNGFFHVQGEQGDLYTRNYLGRRSRRIGMTVFWRARRRSGHRWVHSASWKNRFVF